MVYLISGINKHLNMLLIREKLSEELKLNIPTKCIWNYLDSKWNIEAAVSNKHCPQLFKFINLYAEGDNCSIFINTNNFRI